MFIRIPHTFSYKEDQIPQNWCKMTTQFPTHMHFKISQGRQNTVNMQDALSEKENLNVGG